MLLLPEIPGRFPVGATTFVTPAPVARAFGSAKFKTDGGSFEAALVLREVAFTAYYPSDPSASSKKGLDWLPSRKIRPLRHTLHGFSNFLRLPSWALWPFVYFYGKFLRAPVYPNAPLRKPPVSDKDGTGQWPLVIFSHGLGGGRMTYSQICSRLAASGKVVLAIEHRDGSGIACTPCDWNENGRLACPPTIYYKEDEVIFDNDQFESRGPLPLRTDQLEFRRHEIYAAYDAFRRLLDGDRTIWMQTIDNGAVDESWSIKDGASGKPRVCVTENIALAGHSFGGCTVLSVLSTCPPPAYQHLPVEMALILDPWLEPLPFPGPIPVSTTKDSPLDDDSPTGSVSSLGGGGTEGGDTKRKPQILVLNSESFTLWNDHYTRLKEVVKSWAPQAGRIITLVGSQHSSFSDATTLPLIGRKREKLLMDTISSLCIDFLNCKLDEGLCGLRVRNMEFRIVGKRKDGRPRRRLTGSIGEVIIE